MKPNSTLRSYLALAGSSLLAISSASAADGTWDNNSAGNWTDIANWLGDAAYASGTDSTATFGDFITADRIVTLNAPITIGNITASDITHNYTISGANILTLDRSSGIPTINVTSGRTLTIGSEIAGLDGLQKSGLGTLSLTGTNSYTGTTTITSGILQLNFSITGAPTSNIISNSSVLSLGGGQLTVTGKASTTTSQTFASTSVTGGANTIANIANATANPQLVALGAITRSAGVTLNFSLPTGGQTASNGITTSNTTTNGTIGGWSTVGNVGWAGKTGDNITSGSVTYATTATAGTTAANYTDNNIDVTNSAGLIDNVITPNSLRFDTVGAFTMTLAAGDNIIGSGGILVTGTVGNNTSTITGGNLAGSASGELFIHQHNTTGTSSTLTIGSIIKNNGGATGLTKSGAGTLSLSGNNTYTGITTINTGTVLISHANALGTTAGNTTIAATGSTLTGGQLQLTGGITTAENITITGSSELSGSAAAISGTANNTNTLSGNITLSNLTGGVRIASGNAGARLNFTGTISQTGSSQALVFALGNAGGQNVTINNPIALNGGALSLGGNGSNVILKGVNATDGSGIGTTTINSGGVGLQLGISDAINTTATLTNNGNFNLANFNQTVNALAGASTGILRNTVAGTRTLTVGNGGGSGTYSGTIITGTGNIQLIKTGVGTQTLTGVNTYTGTTAVNGGTLELGVDNCLANSNVEIGAGTLKAAAGVNDTVGTLDATAAATINLGDSAATLAFANSSGVTGGVWAGALNITGTFVPGNDVDPGVGVNPGSIRFGVDNTGLTASQLADITVNGSGTYTLDAFGYLKASGGGPGPLDHFAISAISSPQTVGTPITGITLTAKDASNVTVTSFTGTVNFGGTGGFSGTSGTFTLGELTGVSVTPTIAGSGLTFTVTDPVSGKFGTATFNIQTQYAAWSGASDFDADTNGDGVRNGLAFLLGAANKNDSALSLLPKVSQSGGNLILDFTCLKVAGRGSATLKLQHSKDLGISDAWTDDEVAVPDAAGVAGVTDVVTFTVPTVNADPDLVDLRATIPASAAAPGTKLFGRLQGNNP